MAVTPPPASAMELTMDDLRARRTSARRAAELARMRAKQGASDCAEELARLDAAVSSLTDELIARYAADLSLVDSLLEPAYPANVTSPTSRRDGR